MQTFKKNHFLTCFIIASTKISGKIIFHFTIQKKINVLYNKSVNEHCFVNYPYCTKFLDKETKH